MVLERGVHVRLILLIFGVLCVLAMWGLSLAGDTILVAEGSNVFSSPAAMTLWVILGVANIFFLCSFYGSKPDFFLLLVPLGVIINTLGANLVAALGLPFYLDSIGSMLVGIVGGPALGMLTAGLTSMLAGIYFPLGLPHTLAAVFVAGAVAVVARRYKLTTLLSTMGAGLLLGLAAAVISWITVLTALGGLAQSGTHSLMRFFELMHFSAPVSLLFQEIISDGLDKTYSLMIAALLIRYLPRRVRDLFTSGENELVIKLIFRKFEDLDADEVPEPSLPANKSGRHRKSSITSKVGARST